MPAGRIDAQRECAVPRSARERPASSAATAGGDGSMRSPGPSSSPGPESPASLEERLAAFKADPQLMDAASRFVAELLERAKEEAMRRMRERQQAEQLDVERAGASRKRGRWHSRARGFFMRMLASLCLCNSNGGKGS